jgi:acetone carboxylase alpha subunit
LPEYAEKVYGAVFTRDEKGCYHVDPVKTEERRKQIRQERLKRGKPTREWMKEERERILRKEASVQVRHMYATSFALSEKFLNEFRTFWNLPESWIVTEEELEVPTFGSKLKLSESI